MTVLPALRLDFFFFPPPSPDFHFKKEKKEKVWQSILINPYQKRRRSDPLRFQLKNYFSPLKEKKSTHAFTWLKIIPHLLTDLSSTAYFPVMRAKKKNKGDHGSQSSRGFPLALRVCQLLSDSSGWPLGFRTTVVIRGLTPAHRFPNGEHQLPLLVHERNPALSGKSRVRRQLCLK